MEPRPTIVLVHGGHSTARYWDRLLPHLRSPALAVELPGRGDRPAPPRRSVLDLTLDDFAAAIAADVDAAGVPSVVLMAHSSGALAVPGAVERLGEVVRHVVLSSGTVPVEGGRGIDCMRRSYQDRARANHEAIEATGRPLEAPGVQEPPTPEQVRAGLGGPFPDELAGYLSDPARHVLDSFRVYFEPVRWSAVPASVGRTFLRNVCDRAMPVALQDEMIANLGPATVIDLESGHVPSVVIPGVVAGILDGIAASIEAGVAR